MRRYDRRAAALDHRRGLLPERMPTMTADDPGRGVLVRIRALLPSLRPAEQRVGEAVLADAVGTAELSISRLAEQCGTSVTTVMRFCRAVGFGGYPELRLALVRETSREAADTAEGVKLSSDIGRQDHLQ
jgi:DNA-binding MurR/RpiR family transcriptional regulator